jgi:hypothetical protein
VHDLKSTGSRKKFIADLYKEPLLPGGAEPALESLTKAGFAYIAREEDRHLLDGQILVIASMPTEIVAEVYQPPRLVPFLARLFPRIVQGKTAPPPGNVWLFVFANQLARLRVVPLYGDLPALSRHDGAHGAAS